ncbi:hypothetical protein [Blastococcus sp. SYSU DS0533]
MPVPSPDAFAALARSSPWPWSTTGASRSPTPELRPDGLIAARPEDPLLGYDDPMHEDYHWVAMLDPAELPTRARGLPPATRRCCWTR